MCVHALSLQSCLTLCDSVNLNLPGFSVHGILQARILDSVAMSSSREFSQPRHGTHISYYPAMAGGFFTTSATYRDLAPPQAAGIFL